MAAGLCWDSTRAPALPAAHSAGCLPQHLHLPRFHPTLLHRHQPLTPPAWPALPAPPWVQEVLINVAPKKANWDLRRDIADKLARLERHTQAAMIKLMQQEEQRRMAEDGGQQD